MNRGKDFSGLLMELLSDLIKREFQLPIHVFAVSQSGCIAAARYEWDSVKEGAKVHVFADHKEGDGWNVPVHFFFVDSRGITESVRIDSRDLSVASKITH
jgi:hypothetical protein